MTRENKQENSKEIKREEFSAREKMQRKPQERKSHNSQEKENKKQTKARSTKARATKSKTLSNAQLPMKKGEQEIIETRNISAEIFKKSKLKIIPLGGLHEIGKNITVFEYENEIIVVDCGLSFPEDDMLGVDLVIPDITYLEKNKEKIKGLVITHGHEDHIGSIPYFLKQINVPIYAPKLAVGLIQNKLEEHKLLRSTKMVEVSAGQTIILGNYFKVEFIRSTHSIPDSVMLAITTASLSFAPFS